MKKVKEFLGAIGLIILYFVLSAFSSYYISDFVDNLSITDANKDVLFSILMVIVEIILVVMYALILKNKFRGSFKDFKKNYKDYLPKCLKYWSIGFTALIIFNVIIVYFVSGGIAPNEQANRDILEQYPIYSIISVSILGPILEEMIFRLSFKDIIKKRISYILITGILFGSMHVVFSLESASDLLFILSYSSLGIALSAIYYDTDNICSSMLVHIVHNTITLLLILKGI